MASAVLKHEKRQISKIFQELDPQHASRHRQKIAAIGDVDPYTLKKDDLSADIEHFPSVTYPDIVNYMLFAPSPMTSEELKCFKSLEAYNHFMQGSVKEIDVKSFEDGKVTVTGRVSRKLSTKMPGLRW